MQSKVSSGFSIIHEILHNLKPSNLIYGFVVSSAASDSTQDLSITFPTVSAHKKGNCTPFELLATRAAGYGSFQYTIHTSTS